MNPCAEEKILAILKDFDSWLHGNDRSLRNFNLFLIVHNKEHLLDALRPSELLMLLDAVTPKNGS